MKKYNSKLNKFYEENLQLFSIRAYKQLGKKATEFKSSCIKEFGYVHNSYFNIFLNYSLAELDELAFITKEKIRATYFSKEIYYNNYTYMQFFKLYFKKHFEELLYSTKENQAKYNINEMHSYSLISKSILSLDSAIVNDTLRELFIVNGLQEIYYQPGFNKKSIELILSQVVKNGIHPENKKIANNILTRVSKLQVNQKSPAFEASNILTSKNTSLTSLLGSKLIYISFWDIERESSVSEILAIKKLQEKYSDNVLFVSICSTQENASKKFIEKNKLNWTFLFSQEEKLIEDYNIHTYPIFYLLNKDGYLLSSPAPSPSENIEQLLIQYTSKK